MYQINMRAQASKLASLTERLQIAHVLRPATPRQHALHLRAASDGLAKLATLRVMPGSSANGSARPDPRDPSNW
jgi:hypothetical protein